MCRILSQFPVNIRSLLSVYTFKLYMAWRQILSSSGRLARRSWSRACSWQCKPRNGRQSLVTCNCRSSVFKSRQFLVKSLSNVIKRVRNSADRQCLLNQNIYSLMCNYFTVTSGDISCSCNVAMDNKSSAVAEMAAQWCTSWIVTYEWGTRL